MMPSKKLKKKKKIAKNPKNKNETLILVFWAPPRETEYLIMVEIFSIYFLAAPRFFVFLSAAKNELKIMSSKLRFLVFFWCKKKRNSFIEVSEFGQFILPNSFS